jgi:hypothetical protein
VISDQVVGDPVIGDRERTMGMLQKLLVAIGCMGMACVAAQTPASLTSGQQQAMGADGKIPTLGLHPDREYE